jgi:hypothetical protein
VRNKNLTLPEKGEKTMEILALIVVGVVMIIINCIVNNRTINKVELAMVNTLQETLRIKRIIIDKLKQHVDDMHQSRDLKSGKFMSKVKPR